MKLSFQILPPVKVNDCKKILIQCHKGHGCQDLGTKNVDITIAQFLKDMNFIRYIQLNPNLMS